MDRWECELDYVKCVECVAAQCERGCVAALGERCDWAEILHICVNVHRPALTLIRVNVR